MTVRYEVRGRVAVVTIDRPDRRNAIDRATAVALAEAWRRFEGDENVDVGILHGAGGTFSAGADLKSFDLVDTPGGFLGFTRMTVSKPTIAAVEGYCVAGGLEMALWCDLRVAGRSAIFGCFERRFGVPLVDGGTQRLPRIVGQGRALDMILTGRPVETAEASQIGLVDRVVEDGTSLEEAIALASRIAEFPQPTLRADRLALLEGVGRPMGEGLEVERRHGLRVLEVGRAGAARFARGAGRSGAAVSNEEIEMAQEPPPAQPASPPEPVPAPATRSTPRSADPGPYRAEPASGRGRGILVLHDRWGLTAPMRDTVDALAEAGYVSVAPDLFRGELPGDAERANRLVESLDPDATARFILRQVGELADDEAVTGERVGVIGFGIGGGLAQWLATLDQQIATVVSFGGVLPFRSVRPAFRQAQAAFLGHHAERDPDADRSAGYRLEAELRDLGLDATYHTYPGVSAGFWDPSRPATYHRDLADLAWERTWLFLERTLR